MVSGLNVNMRIKGVTCYPDTEPVNSLLIEETETVASANAMTDGTNGRDCRLLTLTCAPVMEFSPITIMLLSLFTNMLCRFIVEIKI